MRPVEVAGAVRRVTVRLLVAWVVYALVVLSVLAQGAAAEGPGWMLTAAAVPTYLPPGGKGAIQVNVFNVGAGASHGTVTVTDVLPPGIKAVEAGGIVGEQFPNIYLPTIGSEQWACTGNAPGESPRVIGKFQLATVVTCTNVFSEFQGGGGAPTADKAVGPNLQPRVAIVVEAPSKEVSPAEAAASPDRVTIAGGEAPTPASASVPVPVSSSEPAFGISGWDGWFSNADGSLDTRAGSHPYEATFALSFTTTLKHQEEFTLLQNAGGEVRDIVVGLPPGLVADPLAVPQCTRDQLDTQTCPAASQVGVVTAYLAERFAVGFKAYNIVPPPGVPAEIGFNFDGSQTLFEAGVRSGSDYGINVSLNGVSASGVVSSVVTLWNVPSEASHNRWRRGELGGCTQEEIEVGSSSQDGCKASERPLSKPFVTLPTKCGSLAPTTIHITSWERDVLPAEAKYRLHDASGNEAEITGCEHLAFGPALMAEPDTAKADTPTGLTVRVNPPVGGLEEQGQLGTSDIRDTTVALPVGLVVNPGQAAGLQTCPPGRPSPAQHIYGDALTTSAEQAKGEEDNGPAYCPGTSKVATFTAKSPLIEDAEEKQFEGSVYVLPSNPPELKLLIAASADGVNLKLTGTASLCEAAGEVIGGKTCEAPGQIITTFPRTPELPATEFKLSFSGGPQAALDTPVQCGTYTASADFTPWSTPFMSDFLTTGSFSLNEGPGGGPCPSNPLPFTPQMTAGATTDLAGGYTNFSMLLSRLDGQQRISRLQFKTPTGLLGMISHVTLCEEPRAAQGDCPASSQIGHTVVGAGPGPYPLYLPEPGRPEAPIYVTGPYEGAPYGLSIVVPVIAGPFNLGTVVQRAKIEVDPQTSQLTITTDPLLQLLKGVPADLRTINAVIDRKEFMFNPTNCNPQSFSGTATSIEGASAPLSSPFQVGSCRSLVFKPTFKVAAGGLASRVEGTSLHVMLDLPDEGGLSSEANVQRVRVSLPKALPTPLKTLQKACLEKTFAENPKSCPAASQVGQVKVQTPVLPGGLTGTAYFVSHGGAKYPELIFVLVGQNGVTVQVHGETQISKQGITTATFATIPDVPFSSFELTLPQREYPAITANGNLCAAKNLVMPTEMVGQNGLVIKQSTKIAVTGCGKARHAKHRKHKRRR